MRSLLPLENEALNRFESAVSKDRKPHDIVMDVSQCSEFLFKSICSLEYNVPQESNKIDEPIRFLDRTKGFFGRTTNGRFKYHTPRLGRIKKQSESINIIANPAKHEAYQAKKNDALTSLHAIMDILKWYYKGMYDYSQLYLTNKQRKLFDTHFN